MYLEAHGAGSNKSFELGRLASESLSDESGFGDHAFPGFLCVGWPSPVKTIRSGGSSSVLFCVLCTFSLARLHDFEHLGLRYRSYFRNGHLASSNLFRHECENARIKMVCVWHSTFQPFLSFFAWLCCLKPTTSFWESAPQKVEHGYLRPRNVFSVHQERWNRSFLNGVLFLVFAATLFVHCDAEENN